MYIHGLLERVFVYSTYVIIAQLLVVHFTLLQGVVHMLPGDYISVYAQLAYLGPLHTYIYGKSQFMINVWFVFCMT